MRHHAEMGCWGEAAWTARDLAEPYLTHRDPGEEWLRHYLQQRLASLAPYWSNRDPGDETC